MAGLALAAGRCVAVEEVDRPTPVVPLERTEPAEAEEIPAGDLVHLAGWIEDAAIVGLGENVHGTHTLHRLAHRIFQHLVEHEGFEIFALEIDQAHAALLDEYVQGDRDDLDRLLDGGWWGQKIFHDEALRELLVWMRRHNESAERPLHFAGFDLKQPRLAAERLVSTIGAVDPKATEAVSALLPRAFAPGAFGIFPNVWGFTGTIRFALPEAAADARALVEVGVRGEGVDYGYVGFSARPGAGKPSAVRWVPIGALKPTATTYSVELELPASARSLELTIFHRGNGTVWFERPAVRVGNRRLAVSGGLESVEPQPLMMPALQRMDYRAEVVEGEADGGQALRITADPRLDASLNAASALGKLVEEALRLTEADHLSKPQADWTRQFARLVSQAVEWRTLAEPNRDVFLAENLLWLHRTAFPGRRVLAVAHTSHTERRPGKMGAFLADALGGDSRTVSMAAGSGSYRDFGDPSNLTHDAPLELSEIGPAQLSDLETAVGKLHSGSFLLRLSEAPATSGTLDPALLGPSRPDAIVFVRGVEPLRRLP